LERRLKRKIVKKGKDGYGRNKGEKNLETE